MRKYIVTALLILLLISCGGEQRNILATPTPMSTIAFPNAVGFGANTIGGRGGVVYQVTNLNNSGIGSLREAASKSGARIIIFKVSGTITLATNIYIDNPYITILGQTSPNGIVLKGSGLKIRTHDVIVRGLAIRLGNETTGSPLDSRVGIIINSDGKPDPYNIMIDHVSISWGVDELLSIFGGAKDVTISNSIFAEALNCAGHSEGCHPYGVVIGAESQNITVYKNILVYNKWRNPAIYGNASVEVINNVIHSWGTGSITILGVNNGKTKVNIIGNYTSPTSCSTVKGVLIVNSTNAGSKVYTDDWSNVSGNATLINSVKSNVPAFTGSGGIVPSTKEQAYIEVLTNSGARNDATDQRIKNNVINGTLPNNKCNIDSANEVGGWEAIANIPYPTDSDNDGLPDSFEGAVNLNPADIAPSGYAWIEEYANAFYSTFPVTPVSVTSLPVTFTSAPSLTPTRTPTFPYTVTSTQFTGTYTPTRTPTRTVTPTIILSATPTPTAICTPVFDVWVCNRKP